jgi:hypothetical protein
LVQRQLLPNAKLIEPLFSNEFALEFAARGIE